MALSIQHWSLQTKTVLSFLFITVLTLIVLGGTSYLQLNANNEQLLRQEMQSLSEQVALQTQSHVQGALADMVLLSKTEVLAQYLLIPDLDVRANTFGYTLHNVFRNHVTANPDFSAILLFNTEGVDELYYQRAAPLAGGQIQMIQSHLSPTNATPKIIHHALKNHDLLLIHPIHLTNQYADENLSVPPKWRGTLAAVMNFKFLEAVMQRATLRDRGFIFFGNTQGEILVAPEGVSISAGLTKSLASFPEKTLQRHQKHLYYRVRLPYDLVFYAGLPAAEFQKTTTAITLQVVGVALITMVIALFGFLLLIRQGLVTPMQQLIAKMAEVTKTGKLTQVEVGHVQEWMEVAQHFNAMVARVEANLQEINQLYHMQSEMIENEKARIASDFHDQIGQLVSLAKQTVEQEKPYYECYHAIETIDQGLRKVIDYLYPIDVKEHSLGVSTSLTRLVENMGRLFEQSVSLEIYEVGRLSETQELAIYRIAQEALLNAFKYAAHSDIQLLLYEKDHGVLLEVIDTGPGFELERIKTMRHHGYQFMEMRAKSVNGKLNVKSTPGQGTHVLFALERPQ